MSEASDPRILGLACTSERADYLSGVARDRSHRGTDSAS